jgi:hypothetical protein
MAVTRACSQQLSICLMTTPHINHPPNCLGATPVASLEAGLPSKDWLLDLERNSQRLLPACSDVQLSNLGWALRRLDRVPATAWLAAFAARGGRLLATDRFGLGPLAAALWGIEGWGATASGLPWWEAFVAAAKERRRRLRTERGREVAKQWQQTEAAAAAAAAAATGGVGSGLSGVLERRRRRARQGTGGGSPAGSAGGSGPGSWAEEDEGEEGAEVEEPIWDPCGPRSSASSSSGGSEELVEDGAQ